MKVDDFDYLLPPERIAQEPVEPRDAARLLVHDLASGRSEHAHVRDLDAFLDSRDTLVLNDTRVRAARFVGVRATGGAVELLLLEPLGAGVWRALAQPAGRIRAGEELALEGGALIARALERPARDDGEGPGEWRFALLRGSSREPADDGDLERAGRMPLPPYIRRPKGADPLRELDKRAYQTVFARVPGAVAAPTAGLHFTTELLERLERRGIDRAAVTLHVGEGTFKPIAVDDTASHRMHAERFDLPEATAAAIARCRARGGRVFAVGTTSARVLETRAAADGLVEAGAGETRLFLVPPHRFRVVDALLTNFHLPRSTLLMLVSAFAGRERVLELYREAVERGYRFYSYGDAMLLLGAPRA